LGQEKRIKKGDGDKGKGPNPRVKPLASDLLRAAGEIVLDLTEAETEAETYVTPAMSAQLSSWAGFKPLYYAILYFSSDTAMQWGVAKRMFENRKGEMVVVWLAEVEGMKNMYCLSSTDVEKRTAVDKKVPRVALEYTAGGFPNTIVLTCSMMEQVRMFDAVEKTKNLFKTAKRHITAYDGGDEGFHAHKHLQNDMIQVAVQTHLRTKTQGAGPRPRRLKGPDPAPGPIHLEAIVLDSIGFRSSRAVIEGARLAPREADVPVTVHVTVPNFSGEFGVMEGTEPPGVTLVPVSLAEAVRGIKERGSVSVLIADTCGTFNEELREVLTSAFSRHLFADQAVLSITVNCRGMKTRAVLQEMKDYLVQVAATFGARFECTREYKYNHMAFLLGVVGKKLG
jgi:hypothetical protein